MSNMKPDNIFANIPGDLETEIFERLAGGGQVTIERIISRGHASPASGWYDQETSPHIAPVSGMLARGRCDWAPFWSESHSCSYDLSEEQVQAWLNKPGPG